MEEPRLPGTIDWSKVTKEDKITRAAFEQHLASDLSELVKLLSQDFTDIALLKEPPPLPIVTDEDPEFGVDEYAGLSALQSIALQRAKEEAKRNKENEAEILAKMKADEEERLRAEALKDNPDAVDAPPEAPKYPAIFQFLQTSDKRALKAVCAGLGSWTKQRMVAVTVRDVNKTRAQRLFVFKQLREMRGEGLGRRGVSALSLGIARLPVLMSLHLEGNMAKNKGMLHLARALPHCKWLRHINVSRNEFDDKATPELAKALGRCRQLMLVDLSRNAIGDDGCVELAMEMVRRCKKLAKLNLYRNRISDIGAFALCKALPENTALTSLDVRHNLMNSKGCELLSGVVPHCTVRATFKNSQIELQMREYQAVGVKYSIRSDEVEGKK